MSTAASILDSTSAPLVSLCVSAHNYGRFLGACIDSILNQSYRNIECIVVDDGSSDNTGEVLARYADRIKVARHDVAQGHLNALITGFRLAQGQFVSFVDADEWLYRDFVLTHVTVLISPETFAAMSSSMQHNVDESGRVLGIHPIGTQWPQQRLPRGTWRHRRVASAALGEIPIVIHDSQCNFMHQWLWGATSSMMFRSHLLALILDPPPDGSRVFADGYLAQFCHAIGGTATIEMPLGTYRRHGGNMYADNTLVCGLAPLATRRNPDQDPTPVIARQIEMNQQKFCRALGPRRFVVILEKFGSFSAMRRAVADSSVDVGGKSVVLFMLLRASRLFRIYTGRWSLLLDIARLREIV